MVLLTLDTTIEDYTTFLTERIVVEQGVDINDSRCFYLDVEKFLKHYIDIGLKTMRDISNIPETSYSSRWAVYALRDFGEFMDEELVTANIKRISRPMDAFHVYLSCDFLTNEDDTQLEAIFQGKLLRAEKELENGIVTRRKVS